PIMDTDYKLVESGDRVHRIEGCPSGTLGYLFGELGRGKRFSQALRGAIAKGYPEPDPREDLSGSDVARKALILGRLLGFAGELANVAGGALHERCRAAPRGARRPAAAGLVRAGGAGGGVWGGAGGGGGGGGAGGAAPGRSARAAAASIPRPTRTRAVPRVGDCSRSATTRRPRAATRCAPCSTPGRACAVARSRPGCGASPRPCCRPPVSTCSPIPRGTPRCSPAHRS